MTAVTSKLLDIESKLVTVENEEKLTALQMLAQFCEFSQSFNTWASQSNSKMGYGGTYLIFV